MNKIDEQQLQEWERYPLKHRQEIERTELLMSKEFCNSMDAGTRYYNLYRYGTPEYEQAEKENRMFMQTWNRLTELKLVILRHDTEKFIASRKPKPRRRVVISNNAATLIQAAEQYEVELYLKRFLVMGKA